MARHLDRDGQLVQVRFAEQQDPKSRAQREYATEA